MTRTRAPAYYELCAPASNCHGSRDSRRRCEWDRSGGWLLPVAEERAGL